MFEDGGLLKYTLDPDERVVTDRSIEVVGKLVNVYIEPASINYDQGTIYEVRHLVIVKPLTKPDNPYELRKRLPRMTGKFV